MEVNFTERDLIVAVQQQEIKRLREVIEQLKQKYEELLSYLPKVPTEPYEKTLAKKVVGQQAIIEKLKEQRDLFINQYVNVEFCEKSFPVAGKNRIEACEKELAELEQQGEGK